jgi:hypothetical protein
MSTRRITVEEVLEASRTVNFKLRRGSMVRKEIQYACAQGALLLASGVEVEEVNNIGYLLMNDIYGEPYAANFRNGFDGFILDFGGQTREVFYRPQWTGDDKQRADLGFADGQAVAAAVFQTQGAHA